MELEPINDTPYEAAIIPFPSAGSTFHSVIVKAAFELTPGAPAQKAQEQIPLTGADINNGDPQETAVRYESDFVPFKPQADVFCAGKAYAPEGSVTTETLIRFKVGPVNKIIRPPVPGHLPLPPGRVRDAALQEPHLVEADQGGRRHLRRGRRRSGGDRRLAPGIRR